MPPKKDAKAAPAGGPDLAADLQKAQTLGVVTAANFNDRLKPVEAEVERLRRQNAELQASLSKAQDEGKATYTFAQQQVSKKDAQIDSMRSTIERLEAELARKPGELKQAVETAVSIVQGELHRTQHKLREREQALERLADFGIERAQLVAELDNTRQELEREKDVHSTDVAMLQRANVADREHVRGILLERLKTAKSEIIKQAADQMGESVKRIVAENAAMLHELAYQSKQAERLAGQVDKLTDENSTLRMNLSVAEGELRELFRRVSAMAGALKQARSHLKQVQAHEARLQEKEREAEARDRGIEEKAEAFRRRLEMYKGTLGAPAASTSLAVPPIPASPGGTTSPRPGTQSSSSGTGRQWIKSEAVRLPAPMSSSLSLPPPAGHAPGAPGSGQGGAAQAGAVVPSFSPLKGAKAVAGAHVPASHRSAAPAVTPAEGKELELAELQLVDMTASSSAYDREGTEREVDRAALDAALDIIVLMDAQRAEILAVADDVTASLLRAATAVRQHVHALTASQGSTAAKDMLAQAEEDAAEVAGLQGNDAVLFMEAARALERLLGKAPGGGVEGEAELGSGTGRGGGTYAWNLKPMPVSSASAVSGPSALALLKGSGAAALQSAHSSGVHSPANGSATGTGTAASDPASLGGHSSWGPGGASSSGSHVGGGLVSRGILATAPRGVLPTASEKLPDLFAPVVARGGTLQAADAVAAGVATPAQHALVGGTATGSGPAGVRALTSTSAQGQSQGAAVTPGKGGRAPASVVTGSQGGATAKEALAVYTFLHFLVRRMKAVLADMQRAVPAPLTVEQLLQEHALGGAGGGASAGAEQQLSSPGFAGAPAGVRSGGGVGFSVESELVRMRAGSTGTGAGRIAALRAALANKTSSLSSQAATAETS